MARDGNDEALLSMTLQEVQQLRDMMKFWRNNRINQWARPAVPDADLLQTSEAWVALVPDGGIPAPGGSGIDLELIATVCEIYMRLPGSGTDPTSTMQSAGFSLPIYNLYGAFTAGDLVTIERDKFGTVWTDPNSGGGSSSFALTLSDRTNTDHNASSITFNGFTLAKGISTQAGSDTVGVGGSPAQVLYVGATVGFGGTASNPVASDSSFTYAQGTIGLTGAPGTVAINQSGSSWGSVCVPSGGKVYEVYFGNLAGFFAGACAGYLTDGVGGATVFFCDATATIHVTAGNIVVAGHLSSSAWIGSAQGYFVNNLAGLGSVTTGVASASTLTFGGGHIVVDGGIVTGGTSGSGGGTVTSVTISSSGGISGTVATSTTTPAITITLADTVLFGSDSLTLTGNSTTSGVNTGDQTTITGNAGTASALTPGATINGVAFTGASNITVPAAAGTLTGSTLASGVTASSLTSFGSSIALGTPASGVLTNCTGTASGLTAGAVTTNANLTGPVTSSGNATTIVGPLPLRQRVTTAVTAAAVGAFVTDLTVTLAAGKSYNGRVIIYCNQSIAVDGIGWSWSSGTATMTYFKSTQVAYNSAGLVALAPFQGSGISTIEIINTLTGECMIVIDLVLTVNAGGTLIFGFSNVTGLGTVTVEEGSSLVLDMTAN